MALINAGNGFLARWFKIIFCYPGYFVGSAYGGFLGIIAMMVAGAALLAVAAASGLPLMVKIIIAFAAGFLIINAGIGLEAIPPKEKDEE